MNGRAWRPSQGEAATPPVPRRVLDGLRASAEAGEAAWLLDALRDFDFTVGSIVPPVFDSYVRVFHPAGRASGDDEVDVRWAEVAAANGRVMHPAAEWGSLVGSWHLGYRNYPTELFSSEPETGQLPAAVARRLVAVLSEHTARSDEACFGVWEGWGRGSTMFFVSRDTSEEARRRTEAADRARREAWYGLLDGAAKFNVPGRGMHLLRGPLAAIEDFYEFHRNPPSIWWPADRTWCVATGIDLMTTYVGGTRAA
ncbi:MAG: hypothetical protein KGJ43_00965, partial [Acidobacteriota bacterium]|nr:hypothetical protein [Acidobacteriota bacterium]